MNNSLSDDCSTGQRIEHADKVLEAALRQALLKTNQDKCSHESQERDAETREESETPSFRGAERGFSPGKSEKREQSDNFSMVKHLEFKYEQFTFKF